MLILSSIVWGPLSGWTAGLFAIGLVGFHVYWLVRSYTVAVGAVIGRRRMRQWQRRNWTREYDRRRIAWPEAPAWDWPRHLVIIPNYKEDEATLARTLGSFAAQANHQSLVVVMAMEEREAGAREKAERLLAPFEGVFAAQFATIHPVNIPGEVAGKGSNEAWAARAAYARLIEASGHDLDRYTVTSCDADAVFDPHYFEALNFLFLTDPHPFRRFWQPVIFNTNNIWDVPAPLRLLEGLAGIIRLASLRIPRSEIFPTSCYSLSWRMLEEVDLWDEEVIPEDWHLFLKCAFSLGDDVRVVPVFLGVGNDGLLAATYWRTLRAHYSQSVRHAWGASDIPYAWRAASGASPLSRRRRFWLATSLTKVHLLWASQWYLVTLGVLAPATLARLGAPMPSWWTDRGFHLISPGATPLHALALPDWVGRTVGILIQPTAAVNLSGLLMALCFIPLVAIIVLEWQFRGPRPADRSRLSALVQLWVWPLMGVITFIWTCVPALDAQWRLASGRGLTYRVAEKSSRSFAPAAAYAVDAPAATGVGQPSELNGTL